MKNWKSTLLGAALAAGDVLVQFLSDPHFDWSHPQNYIRPVLFVLLGSVVADAKKNVPLAVLFLVSGSLLFTGCAGTTFEAITPYGTVTSDAKGHVVVTPQAKPIVIPLGEK